MRETAHYGALFIVTSANLKYCDFVRDILILGALRSAVSKLYEYGAPLIPLYVVQLITSAKWFDDRNGIGTRDS